MPTSSRLITLVMLGAGALAACGGNNNNGADARVTDANTTPDTPAPPDANVEVRNATLAVTQLNLTDPAVALSGIGGASISLEFDDLTKEDGGNLLLDETGGSGIGGCVVYQFDAGAGAVHKPHPAIDEGVITLSGDGLKEPGDYHCAFQGASYLCDGGQQPNESNQSGTYSTSGAGTPAGLTTLTITSGQTFLVSDIGKWLVLTGFNGHDGAYPIVNVTGGNPVLGTGTAVPNTTGDVNFTGLSYAVLQGVAPVGGGAASVNFLGLGAGHDPVTLTLAANTDYPAGLALTVEPLGKGMILDGPGTGCTDCAMPHQFPKSAAASATVSFSCDGTNGDRTGNCGEDDTTGGQLLKGMVITGSTTDASIAGKFPYEMPSPVSSYTTFTCGFIGLGTGQVSNAAVSAILSGAPTRVETRVFRFGFAKSADPTTLSGYTFVTGHGLVGHTDIP
jgi:hypothetical protein